MGGWARNLASALLVGLAWGGLAHASPCPVTASSELTNLGWVLSIDTACQPYARVSIQYGPLRVVEETDFKGRVSVILPVLAGQAVAEYEIADTTETVSVPVSPSSYFVWIEPEGSLRLGLFPLVGFPYSPTQALPELQLFSQADRPRFLDVPVQTETCGRPLRFALMVETWDAPRPVEVQMPGCDAVGGFLRLPLP